MNETIKSIFGNDSITFDEFCERLDGAQPDELFVDKVDYDMLADSYEDLKAEFSYFDPDWEEKAKRIVFDGALDCALKATDAHDTELVKKLLDIGALEYNCGTIVGLDEQLEKLRNEHGYLFENCAPVPSFGRSSNGNTGKQLENEKKSQTNSVLRAVFGRK